MSKKILITGGAGFIGSNSAASFLSQKNKVTILDNFSRKGSELNADWLKKKFKNNLKVVKADIRYDHDLLKKYINENNVVLHLAGQVAVTSSVKNPSEDFDINARGTLNVLEQVRLSKNKPILIYSSTNKVYGGMESLRIDKTPEGYRYSEYEHGVHENHLIDFHSPYGCSKGTADQYVRDYARIYGLKTIVMRQSCIYGTRQLGNEDQGWVIWFVIASVLNKPLTIYGDGHQVRDILFVDDLVKAYHLAIKNIKKTSGKIYNIGGGWKNATSLLGLIKILNKFEGSNMKPKFSDWRPGDQRVFVSDVRKAKKDFGWEPSVSIADGVKMVREWVAQNKDIFEA